MPTPYNPNIISNTPPALYEYPAETTRAVVNIMANNILERYTNLKIIVPHCGSFIPSALPRMKSILPVMVQNRLMHDIDWEGSLSRLYFDLAGNPTTDVINTLLTITTPDHLLYGSDYPFLPDSIMQNNINTLKNTLKKEEFAEHYEKIFWQNAERLFNADNP